MDVREFRASTHGGWEYAQKSQTSKAGTFLAEWNGPECLIEWIKWDEGRVSGTYPASQDLIKESTAQYEKIFARLGKRADISFVNMQNAQDYAICKLVPYTTVLDYGAGYAREAFLFMRDPIRYFATDAIEVPYMLQNWVLSAWPSFWEHFDHQPLRDERIGHLPTWELDRLPSIDLALFIWSLSEMSVHGAEHAMEKTMSKLSTGGHIYLRDNTSHGRFWDHHLIRCGFKPVYNPWKLSNAELHGVPRLYRYMPSYVNIGNMPFVKTAFTLWSSVMCSPRQWAVSLFRLLQNIKHTVRPFFGRS